MNTSLLLYVALATVAITLTMENLFEEILQQRACRCG